MSDTMSNLSNLLLDIPVIFGILSVAYAITVGLRFKSRRACNWVVLRAAALVPGAVLTDDGSRWHKLLRATWETELGGANAVAAKVEVAVSHSAPWDVRVRVLQTGKENGLIATYGWRQWPRAFHDADCVRRKEMRDNIAHIVHVALHIRVRREFRTPLALAQAVIKGFPGVDFEGTPSV
jgi:hypothetical protein